MSIAHWIAVATIATLPWAAHAQDNTVQGGPANSAAATPALHYESPFNTYRAAAEVTESPDKIWRAANAEMGRLGGHIGHTAEIAPSARNAAQRNGSPPAHQTHQQKEGK